MKTLYESLLDDLDGLNGLENNSDKFVNDKNSMSELYKVIVIVT